MLSILTVEPNQLKNLVMFHSFFSLWLVVRKYSLRNYLVKLLSDFLKIILLSCGVYVVPADNKTES